jgi:hypothetical protein
VRRDELRVPFHLVQDRVDRVQLLQEQSP